MILKNDTKFEVRSTKCEIDNRTTFNLPQFLLQAIFNFVNRACLLLRTSYLVPRTLLVLLTFFLASCGVYSFKDVSIPPEVKTVKIGFIENKARYVNPQLSPRLTDRLQQKIINQTRLTRTNNDDAHYQISGYISNDVITTSGISNQTAATNRLSISVHIVFVNTLADKTEEFDVSRNFDFSASLSRPQAEQALQEEIIRSLTDEIFNHVFSNW
jgi:hypothetical protein